MNESATGRTEASPKRRPTWWMLVFPALALVILLGFALHAEIRYRRRIAAIEALQKIAHVQFDGPLPVTWLSRFFGRKTTNDLPVYRVGPFDEAVTVVALEQIARLDELEVLQLNGGAVTDSMLAHISTMVALKELYLTDTNVTDAGLAHIRELTAIQHLLLTNADVGDAGLVHLRSLTALRSLVVSGTKITDAGLTHVRGLVAMVWLDLSGTGITDAGLTHLEELTALEHLDLGGTRVTRYGAAEFTKRQPNVEVVWPWTLSDL